MIGRLLVDRERAVLLHDWMLVQEIDSQLARLGWVPDHGYETVVVSTEKAVPAKRGPGRPRKVVT